MGLLQLQLLYTCTNMYQNRCTCVCLIVLHCSLVMGQCLGDGNITVYTGAGAGEEEMRFPMKTWKQVIIIKFFLCPFLYISMKKFCQLFHLAAPIYLPIFCRWATLLRSLHQKALGYRWNTSGIVVSFIFIYYFISRNKERFARV